MPLYIWFNFYRKLSRGVWRFKKGKDTTIWDNRFVFNIAFNKKMTASSSYGKKSMLYRHSKHIQGGIIVINSYGATRDKKKKRRY